MDNAEHRPGTAEEAREAAARLCDEQAAVFEWQAARQYALASDAPTAKVIRELAARIRGIETAP